MKVSPTPPTPAMELLPVSAYTRTVRPMLPASAFEPARSRALWIPVHYAIIAAVTWALATGHVPWPLWPVASLVIGCSMGGVTFVGHEALHGGVMRGRLAIRVIGWLGFLPFVVSPQLWMAWHNRVHHNHCGQPALDPDMYPTLEKYQSQRAARITADHFGLGGGRIGGLLSLMFGFTGQSGQILVNAQKTKLLTPHLHRRAIIETLAGISVWTAVAFLVGPIAFIFVYVLPLIVANVIVMSFIVTNHNLSPLSPVNDPLFNSLSVTLPRFLEWLTLDFGFHVEHHLFPTMSTRHGRLVREALRERFADRYQSLPLTKALYCLHTTARVYLDHTTLIDPQSGRTWQTLLPRGAQPATLAAPAVPA